MNKLVQSTTLLLSVQNCQRTDRTQGRYSRNEECILQNLRQKYVDSIWFAETPDEPTRTSANPQVQILLTHFQKPVIF